MIFKICIYLESLKISVSYTSYKSLSFEISKKRDLAVGNKNRDQMLNSSVAFWEKKTTTKKQTNKKTQPVIFLVNWECKTTILLALFL